MTAEGPELATELALEGLGDGEKSTSSTWHRYVALSTVVLAALAAVAALFAGITAHEDIVERTNKVIEITAASEDRIQARELRTKHEILSALGLPIDPDEQALIAAYDQEAEELAANAASSEAAAEQAGSTHLILAVAATVLGIGIVTTGLSVILAKRWVWAAGGVIGALGIGLLAYGLYSFVA
jgi:Flp pilus assembly protein TadB